LECGEESLLSFFAFWRTDEMPKAKERKRRLLAALQSLPPVQARCTAL
jgi:hypothetical protein